MPSTLSSLYKKIFGLNQTVLKMWHSAWEQIKTQNLEHLLDADDFPKFTVVGDVP